MSSQPRMDDQVRATIMADPAVLLDDTDIMKILVAANEQAMGSNVVDLRGIAMKRLEARLDRLEDTHRSVIAAAYDNLVGTHQIHRAVLRLLEPESFEEFLRDLGTEVRAVLKVESLRLVLEAGFSGEETERPRFGGVIAVEDAGFVDAYLRNGRRGPVKAVTLRECWPEDDRVHGAREGIRSEACLRLDLGEGRRPGMLVLGSRDAGHFAPQQGTDLLAFFGAAFERALRRWLA